MAAEAELLQQIFYKKNAEKYKTPHPMLNTPKTWNSHWKRDFPIWGDCKKEAKCEASDATKSGKSVELYAKSACTPFVTYANSMQDKLAQEAQSVKH